MNKIIYLDTNIFLHYQLFTQINWPEIVKAETVTIVIPPIIIRELNKHKDSHPSPKIKKRAGETIKKLSSVLNPGIIENIAEGVSIYFEDRDSTIDFASNQLNFNIQDDQLIASILMNKQESPDQEIVLVTSDLGLALIAKAGRQGISTQKLPDKLKIADEIDPNEIKVKQLQQQIQELNSRIPILSLVYEDGNQLMAFKLETPISLSESEIETKMTEIKKEFPKWQEKEASKEADCNINTLEKSVMLTRMSITGLFPQTEIDRYNKEVEQYIPAYKAFLENSMKFNNLKKRTLKLGIALSNNGTTPAKDIDIYMHFPDGFQLIEEDEFPKPPKPLKPPNEPRTEMQRIMDSFDFSRINSFPVINNFPDISPKTQRNVSSPSNKRVNSFEVHIHIQKIKHNLQLFLDPLYVVFDSYESAKSFEINYRLLAANIPHEVTGNLHIIIEKEISN